MRKELSPRAAVLDRLRTEQAFAVLARAGELERGGREIVHLEIGEPDFDTPRHVAEAGVAAIRAGRTHYAPTAGTPGLRAAAAAELGRRRRIAVDPAHVLVANGAKPFLFFTVSALCGPGDEVIYPDPSFPIYESTIRWVGATPVPLTVGEETGFGLDLERLAGALSPKTKLVILNSPHNPTGGVIAPADLGAAAALIARSSAWVLSDEVYSRFLYDEEFASIATAPGMLERTVIVDGFSKTYAMTGWRCGFAAVPGGLVESLTRFLVNSTSCVPPFVQDAGVAALEGPQDEVEAMVAEFRRRRDVVVARLDAMPGVSCRLPAGAFYAFPNVAGVPVGAEALATRLLEEAGVAVLAGSSFGPGGADHLRISYANSVPNLERGLERIADFIAALPAAE